MTVVLWHWILPHALVWKEGVFVYLLREGRWGKSSGKRMRFEKISRAVLGLSFCELERLEWNWGKWDGKAYFLWQRGDLLASGPALSPPFHSHILFSLGSRPAVLSVGRGKPEPSLMALGQDTGLRGSISARQRGGKFLIKTIWPKRKARTKITCGM